MSTLGVQNLFSKVRAVVFVAEATQLFEKRTMRGAMDEIFSEHFKVRTS